MNTLSLPPRTLLPETTNRVMKGIVPAALLGAMALLLVSCAPRRGPAERAGAQIDRAAEDAADAVEDAADDAGNSIRRSRY